MSTNRRALSSYFAILILIALTTVGGFIIYRATLPNTKITNNIQTQTNKAIILETKKIQNNTINLYIKNLGTSTQTIEKIYFNDILASQPQYKININNPGVEDDYLYPQETTTVTITSSYKPGETYKIRIITDLNSIVQTIVKIPDTLSVPDESGHWWNTSYQYRRRIQIQTSIATPESYSVTLVVNKNQLEYKPAFEDIRVLHYSNRIYQELDRIIREDDEELAIIFKTIENTPSNTQCQDYFNYYCNPSARIRRIMLVEYTYGMILFLQILSIGMSYRNQWIYMVEAISINHLHMTPLIKGSLMIQEIIMRRTCIQRACM